MFQCRLYIYIIRRIGRTAKLIDEIIIYEVSFLWTSYEVFLKYEKYKNQKLYDT